MSLPDQSSLALGGAQACSERSLTSAQLSSLRALSPSPPAHTFTSSHPHLGVCRSCSLSLESFAFLLLFAWLTQLHAHLCREGSPRRPQPRSQLVVSFTALVFTCTHMFTYLWSTRNRGSGSWPRMWLSFMNDCLMTNCLSEGPFGKTLPPPSPNSQLKGPSLTDLLKPLQVTSSASAVPSLFQIYFKPLSLWA